MAHELGDPAVVIGFDAAQALHANFYENFMPSDIFMLRVNQVKGLISNLRPLNGFR